jgi:hypothetical protein
MEALSSGAIWLRLSVTRLKSAVRLLQMRSLYGTNIGKLGEKERPMQNAEGKERP